MESSTKHQQEEQFDRCIVLGVLFTILFVALVVVVVSLATS